MMKGMKEILMTREYFIIHIVFNKELIKMFNRIVAMSL